MQRHVNKDKSYSHAWKICQSCSTSCQPCQINFVGFQWFLFLIFVAQILCISSFWVNYSWLMCELASMCLFVVGGCSQTEEESWRGNGEETKPQWGPNHSYWELGPSYQTTHIGIKTTHIGTQPSTTHIGTQKATTRKGPKLGHPTLNQNKWSNHQPFIFGPNKQLLEKDLKSNHSKGTQPRISQNKGSPGPLIRDPTVNETLSWTINKDPNNWQKRNNHGL